MQIVRILSLCFFSVHLWSSTAAAVEIVALKTFDIEPYNLALKGFKSTCQCTVKEFALTEIDESKVFLEKVREISPPLLLAVGGRALTILKEINDIPIVYSSVLKPHDALSGEKNIIGVDVNIPPGEVLREFLAISPKTRRVGLLYNPANSGDMVRDILAAAKKLGAQMVVHEVTRTKDVYNELQKMRGNIEAFWMLPDISVVNRTTGESIMLFSMENRIPIITFAERFMNSGAFITMSIDELDMGKQTGEMASHILAGMAPWDVPKSTVRKSALVINTMVGNKLGILDKAGLAKTIDRRMVVSSDDPRFMRLEGDVKDKYEHMP